MSPKQEHKQTIDFDNLWERYNTLAESLNLHARGDREKAWLKQATKAPLALLSLEERKESIQDTILICCLLNIIFDDLPNQHAVLHELLEKLLHPDHHEIPEPNIGTNQSRYANLIRDIVAQALPKGKNPLAQTELYEAYKNRNLSDDTSPTDEKAGKGMIAGVFLSSYSKEFNNLSAETQNKLIHHMNMIGRIGNDLATGEREMAENSYTWLLTKIPKTNHEQSFTDYALTHCDGIKILLREHTQALLMLQLEENFLKKLQKYCSILWKSEVMRTPLALQAILTPILDEICQNTTQ